MSDYFNLNEVSGEVSQEVEKTKKRFSGLTNITRNKYFNRKVIIPSLIMLAIPLTVGLALVQQSSRSRAGGGLPIASVAINPGIIKANIETAKNPVELSALAYDNQGNPLNYGVNYDWSISSTDTVGTLTKTNGVISQFKPYKAGCGVLTVTATYGGQSMTKAVVIQVSDGNFVPKCEDSGSTPISNNVNRVFVTSSTYDGNFGGLSGADNKCQVSANSASLGGEWKAWISDKNTSAVSRIIHSNGAYKLLNESTIAKDWEDLTDGTLDFPINITELGTPIPTGSTDQVWTSTGSDGTTYSYPNGTIYDCNGWTDNTYTNYGFIGHATNSSRYWSNFGDTQLCGTKIRLYCIEQVPTPTPVLKNQISLKCDANISLSDYSSTELKAELISQGNGIGGQKITWSRVAGTSEYPLISPGSSSTGMYGSASTFVWMPEGFKGSGTGKIQASFAGDANYYPATCITNVSYNIGVSPTPAVRKMIIAPSADAFVRSSAPTTNFGKSQTLMMDTNPSEIPYFKFDLSSLKNKTITKATLVLTVNSASNSTQTVKLANSNNWSETGLTYRNRPTAQKQISTFIAKPSNGKVNVNVLSAVNLGKGKPMSLMITSGSNAKASIYSREASSSKRPQLIVEYK